MRYLILTYYIKPDGRIEESMEVSKKIKTRDLQIANVILDFKKLEVVKASMGGVNVPKNFNNITSYYRQHYKNIIDRLFAENGYEIVDVDPNESKEEKKENVE